MLSIQMGRRVRGTSQLRTEREVTRWRCLNQSSHVLPPTCPIPVTRSCLVPCTCYFCRPSPRSQYILLNQQRMTLPKKVNSFLGGLAPGTSSASARSSREEAAGASGGGRSTGHIPQDTSKLLSVWSPLWDEKDLFPTCSTIIIEIC